MGHHICCISDYSSAIELDYLYIDLLPGQLLLK